MIHEEILKARRENTSRIKRLWCWLWYGHDGVPESKSVRTCGRCGALQIGGGSNESHFGGTMDILEITKQWLVDHKRDGLFHPEEMCACLLDDLMPCGEMNPGCTAGYKVPCPRKKEPDNPDIECECDLNDPEAWHIQEGLEK